MKIGFFDSGIGGLTVLHEAYHFLGDNEYIFYGDTDHVPYGRRSNEEIMSYADEITQFLIAKDVNAIVIACNTASSVAASALRSKYDLPIIAMEPAVKPALKTDANKRILVTATPVTIREAKLRNLIKREGGEERIDLLPLPDLVGFAENEMFESDEARSYLEKMLADYNKDEYSAVVLGCTHFNYFAKIFSQIFGKDTLIIDGKGGTVRRIAELLGIDTCENEQDMTMNDISQLENIYHTEYYFSGRRVNDAEELGHIMRLHNQLEITRRR